VLFKKKKSVKKSTSKFQKKKWISSSRGEIIVLEPEQLKALIENLILSALS
jgi:hypothetical protein